MYSCAHHQPRTTQIADLAAAMLRKAIVRGLAVAAISGTGACAQQPAKVSNEYNGGPLLQPFGQDVQGELSSRALGGFKGGPGPGFGHTYRVIKIESDPPGASILINGRRFGTTPQAIRVDDDISAMLVGLVKPGYSETGGLFSVGFISTGLTSSRGGQSWGWREGIDWGGVDRAPAGL